MIELVRLKWNQASGSTLDPNLAKKNLVSAVIHVESIDYSSGVVYVAGVDSITFDSEPSDAMGMLYVYKALSDIQLSEVNKKLNSNELGVNWKSGMDSVNTANATKTSEKLLDAFQSQYNNALESITINGGSMTVVDLYEG